MRFLEPRVGLSAADDVEPFSRAPKDIGDFGEGLVTFLLIRQGFEVAVVDHGGADLIAEKGGERFAVSVKTRLFRRGSKESRALVIEQGGLDKLERFAGRFAMRSLFGLVVCLADDQVIHMFVMPVEFVKSELYRAKHGYALRIQRRKDLARLSSSNIFYASLREERLPPDFAFA